MVSATCFMLEPMQGIWGAEFQQVQDVNEAGFNTASLCNPAGAVYLGRAMNCLERSVHTVPRVSCLRVLSGLCLVAFAVSQATEVEPVETPAKYFRSDFGVAVATAGSLPDDFDQPGALLWTVPVDPGQSSPIVCNGPAFLTTYRP